VYLPLFLGLKGAVDVAKRTTRQKLKDRMGACASDCDTMIRRLRECCEWYVDTGNETPAAMLFPFILAIEELQAAFRKARNQM